MSSISVLTPVRNAASFVLDAVESVRRQGRDVEHVVQDGASDDGTAELLRATSGIRLVSEPDGGQADALNRALARAGGDWIAWLNADEFYMPEALHRLRAKGERAGADLVFGDKITCDPEGRAIALLPNDPSRWHSPFVYSCTLLVRRAALGDFRFDTSLRMVMEADLYLALRARGARHAHLRSATAAYRIRDDQVSQRMIGLVAGEVASIRERYPGALPPAFVTRRLRRPLRGGRRVLRDGRRVLRVAALRGTDLRWFDGADVSAILAASDGYGARSPRT